MSATLSYDVTGMTCSHCENAVRQEVEPLTGVQSVEVDASSGALRITVPDAGSVTDEAVLSAVEEAGFEAVRSA